MADFRGHDFYPEIFGLAKTKGWFHVEIEKGMNGDECEKGHEQEAFDGSGVVFQDTIGVPSRMDQFVEAMVFDVPSLAPKTDGTVYGKLRCWERCYPHPIAASDLVFLVESPSYRAGLQRANDPRGTLHLRP